ncbi:DNA sulfur modification protein DndD [Bradyrhizobium sp. USDA 4532]|uniref:AAA family ATPase n=1 Tax=unclassified Bradyrhizobium TaxID=2631580 RepID=UPI00209E7252|nr:MULTISPECIES: AAA family ATPase [unclassified Bradyrhizobium]MCP1829095.1 DNA sulfur modification protein DndD [Bradyrhizobium sp. USDA 4545]MCP1922204.1 DNA sulfur modification protein DndD [Bradyrhizobium sp. USDA 4532]
MKLQKLTCHNFMPYRGVVELEFPTDDFQNVMIVFGDNMRGKTSLLNAIRWGFYGRAIGRHSRPIMLHELVNKDAALEDDWRIEVFVRFESNGRQYDLRRSAVRRPHVANPTRPEDFQMSVYLSRDGMQLSGDQVNVEIDQIAPEQISRFFLFDGELLGEYESLLIEGSEQGRQIKDAIEQVLGVPALIYGRAELGAILKSATKRQTSELAHIQGLEKQAQRQQELTAKQDAHERDIQDLQARLANVRAERNKLDDELEAAASVLAAKGKLDALTGQKDSLETRREQKRLERQALLGQAWRDLVDARLETKREQLQRQQILLTQGLKEQGRLQSRIDDLVRLLDSSECPTCGQELNPDRRTELGSSLGRLQAEASQIRDNNDELQAVSGQLASLGRIRGVNARDRLRQIDKDAKATEVDLQKTENEIERLKDEIAGQDTADLARKRVLQTEALKEEGRLTQSINDVRRDIEKIKEELAIAQKAIESLAPARSKRSTLKVSLASDLERVFAASVEDLRDRLRERVGTLANEAFKKMTTQREYRGLEINSNYGLSILDGGGRKVPLRSAGAEQVVALSLIDGLNRTGRGVGPVVMDTPFGRLDLNHRDNILGYLPSVTSQFVLLVHSGEIRPETDLASIRPRIGAVYRIAEVTPTQSLIERTTI